MPDGIIGDSGSNCIGGTGGEVLYTGIQPDCTPSDSCVACGIYDLDAAPCWYDCTVSWSAFCYVFGLTSEESQSVHVDGGSVTFKLIPGGVPCGYAGGYSCAGSGTMYFAFALEGACSGPTAPQWAVNTYVNVKIIFKSGTGGNCNLIIQTNIYTFMIIEPIFSGDTGITLSGNWLGSYTGLNCTSSFPITESPPYFPVIGSPPSDLGYAPVVTISPSTTTGQYPCYPGSASGCPPFVAPIGTCVGSSPAPSIITPPFPPILYEDCPNSGACDDSQPTLCVQVVEAGLSTCSTDIIVTGPVTTCISGISPMWNGGAGTCSARITWIGTTGAATVGLGNFILSIFDGTGNLIWQGCSATLTGSYAYITDAPYPGTTYPAITSINVISGACAPCTVFACPGGILSSYSLALTTGTIVGSIVPDTGTSPCDGITPYFFSQTIFSWSNQTIIMNQVGGLCQWAQTTVGVVTCTRTFYDVTGLIVICTSTPSFNPSWEICLDSGATGLWQLTEQMNGAFPGVPAGTLSGCLSQAVWSSLCHAADLTGTYDDGSILS